MTGLPVGSGLLRYELADAARREQADAERDAVLGDAEGRILAEDRRDRVELEVGRAEVGARAHERAGLGHVRGERAGALLLEGGHVRVDEVGRHRGRQADRLRGAPQGPHVHVVLQVAPDHRAVDEPARSAAPPGARRGRSPTASGAAASCRRRRDRITSRAASNAAARRDAGPRQPRRACLEHARARPAGASRPSGSAAPSPGADTPPRRCSGDRRAGSAGSGRRRPARRR